MDDRPFGAVAAAPRRRVGIDLLEVAAVERSLARFGSSYARRVYAPDELAVCVDASGAPDPRRLAGRFAVKEAVLKALDAPDDVVLTDIATSAMPSGAPQLLLRGTAAARAEALGVRSASLSISHDGAYAVAMVVLEHDARTDDGTAR